MRKWTSLLAVAALVTGSAFATEAKTQGTEPTGLTVRAGVFFPSEQTVRDATADAWFTAGLEYKLGDIGVPNYTTGYRAHWSISADYYGQDDFTAVPVLVNYVGHANQFHYSAGAGVTFASLPVEDKTVFGYRLAIGLDFNTGKTPFFVEGGFMGAAGESVDTNLNGFFLVAGLNF
jgi:hypothetical protein